MRTIKHLVRTLLASATALTLTLALAMSPAQLPAQVVVQRLKSFGISEMSGGIPKASPILDADGWLYGTTAGAGSNVLGLVFKVGRDGGGYRVLHSFAGSDGQAPETALVIGGDGVLYGTATAGGSNGVGTVFKLNRDGTGFSVLHSFSGYDGRTPQAALLQASDGWLYGSTSSGGSNNLGSIFKLTTNGTAYSVIHNFSGPDGQAPFGKLVQGLDGQLYGTTYQGGTSNVGTIFKLATDGSNYTLLRSFTKVWIGSGYDGYNPRGGLVQGSDGTLYGSTESGGGTQKNQQLGTVFQINPDGGGFTIIFTFGSGSSYGINPQCDLRLSGDGSLYGTASQSRETGSAGSVFSIKTNRSSFAILHVFNTSGNDGAYPTDGVVLDTNGQVFGTTSQGGSNGVGVIYKVIPGVGGPPICSILHSFSPSGGDAHYPLGKLVQDQNGVIYGVTSAGGTNGCGTLFKINPNGSGYSILRTYSGPDGKNPCALMLSPDGLLYGTTCSGGISNCGTVFKASRDASSYTVLHSFDGLGGSDPKAGVMLATNGALYGTTYGGGTGFYGSSDGTIYRLNPDGTGFVKLHDFNHGNGSDGYKPTAGFVQGIDGDLYSGTRESSYPYQPGTVYKINHDGGGFAVLKFFYDAGGFTAGPCSDLLQGTDQRFYGATVRGVMFRIDSDGNNFMELHTLEANNWTYRPTYLALGDDGNLYGTESAGGPHYAGIIFKMNPDGSGFSTLYEFGAAAGDGSAPAGPLLRGSDGLWYGTTSAGGDMGCGTVFRMVPRPQIQSFGLMPGGPFQFSFASVSNLVYRIDASTNFVDWVALSNLTATASQSTIAGLTSTNFPQRFYRVVWIP